MYRRAVPGHRTVWPPAGNGSPLLSTAGSQMGVFHARQGAHWCNKCGTSQVCTESNTTDCWIQVWQYFQIKQSPLPHFPNLPLPHSHSPILHTDASPPTPSFNPPLTPPSPPPASTPTISKSSKRLKLLSSVYIYIYDLVPKGAHARGYALQLKLKHCWKLFLFEMLCCLLVWMNEYIVQIISATRLWLISRYSHHTLKKRRKMTTKNGQPCTEWFSSLCLQTNQKHMEKQSLICTRKTSFYMDNITSTLTIVVFSINWSRMFALYVRQMCCKLELKTLNNRKTTASLRNQRKHRVCSDPCICSTQRYSFFFQRCFAPNLKNISPIVWYCCNIWRPYKIANILYKTNEKAVSFLSTTSRTSRDLSWVPPFFRPHGGSLFGNTERCVVVFFSGPT